LSFIAIHVGVWCGMWIAVWVIIVWAMNYEVVYIFIIHTDVANIHILSCAVIQTTHTHTHTHTHTRAHTHTCTHTHTHTHTQIKAISRKYLV